MGEFEPVLLTLPSTLAPSLAVEVLPHGFTIHRLLVQVDGKTHDIVIGPEAPEGHVKQKYTNSIVGRYANRIPVGTHQLERNGFKAELTTIKNESDLVSLHGGPDGFDARPWTQLKPDEKPTLFTAAEIAQLSSISQSSLSIFKLESAAGDQGFPGKLLTEALIALVEPTASSAQITDPSQEHDLGSIILVYRAKLLDGNTVTPVNLTQHWGFNLDASLQDGPESLSIKGHRLTIKASSIAELDSHALGTGVYLPVAQLPAHDHNDKLIGDKFPGKGYDDYYLFKEEVLSSVPSRIPASSLTNSANYLSDLIRPSSEKDEETALVKLSSDKSGLKLIFNSNQHGTMFYSNAMANPANGARKKIHGGSGLPDGAAYGPSTAAFLEFHHPLAAFLYPKNKDKEDTLVTSDEIYHNFVRLDVKFKRPQAVA